MSRQLNGQNDDTIAFPKDRTPPVKWFWSLLLYDAEHFFDDNPLKHFSLGTQNKTTKFNAGGSLTLY